MTCLCLSIIKDTSPHGNIFMSVQCGTVRFPTTQFTAKAESQFYTIRSALMINLTPNVIGNTESQFTSWGQTNYLLKATKDKDNITSKGGVIFRYKCKHLGCTVEYMRQVRPLGTGRRSI